jgi:hypothetical protein
MSSTERFMIGTPSALIQHIAILCRAVRASSLDSHEKDRLFDAIELLAAAVGRFDYAGR